MERTAFILVILLSLFSVGLSHSCNFTKQCEFNVTSNGSICTRITTNAQIVIFYRSSNKVINTTVCLPCEGVTVSGTCNKTISSNKGQTSSTLMLSWDNETTNSTYDLGMTFIKNFAKGSKHYTISNITLDVMGEFDKVDVDFTSNATSDFISKLPDLDYTRSYQCKHEQLIDMNIENNLEHNYNATLTFANFRVQSFDFKNTTSGEYGNAYKCTLDASASKIVPIAVGGALGGLIVVVLVAYVIGRLRSRRQSAYEPLS